MKKLVIVTETLGVDGPERVISELTQEWARKGYDITVIVTRSNNKISMYTFSNDVLIMHVDAYARGGKLYRLNEVLALRKVLKDLRPDVCISLMISTSFSLAMASVGLPTKIILSERNDPNKVPFTSFQRALRNLAFEFADAIVFQTKDAMEYFPKRIQGRGKIIFNPVNPDLPERYLGEREKKIVAVGRLADQKNFSVLIRAFGLLVKEHPDYQLVIYGEGNKRDELQKLINGLGISETAHMPGFSDNVYEQMVRSAMYVSSSDYEGMSNSMLEALAMGVPTVCTDCPIGGAHTVIESGVNGVLVPVGDADSMYREMKRIIEDGDYAKALTDEAYKLRDMLNICKIASCWEQLF